MTSHHLRSAYRDELNAAHLRIDTLEAELEAKRAGEACGGRALEEAKGQARAFETKALELESRLRELERSASERSASERARRAAERPSGRNAAPAASEAPVRAQEFAWVALGLVNLGALAVLASLHVGVAMALVAVVVGAAASHGFFARLAGRSFGWHERDERPRRVARPLPVAKPLPALMPARVLKVHPMVPPRLYSTTAPTLVGGLGPRTRLRSKRGRDLERWQQPPARHELEGRFGGAGGTPPSEHRANYLLWASLGERRPFLGSPRGIRGAVRRFRGRVFGSATHFFTLIFRKNAAAPSRSRVGRAGGASPELARALRPA